ncbi:SIS domain-containing protein [Kitasatospora cineracea]|uniref:Fructoselysine-6-P-deglycase FrlB-like protein n=1 Tax=Kitasatospora cineracea TaxID=88074 RepID=A0A8G1UM33_9ACTN|nr:SIS domain-containing protein [Kitasatospora cineracea]ROR46523.1 fructoselysine-6-P-deglycase FrlB-like protein [Kitasatospora cineracea]
MDPALFRSDIEAKPESMRTLAAELRGADPFTRLQAVERVVFLGMGSSRYAATVAAHRLRRAGIDAVAEYASALPAPARAGTLVVAISATGASREVLDALPAYPGHVALTNVAGSPVTEGASLVVPMLAGEEKGGVACRSFQHTLALLLALENRLTGAGRDLPGLLERAAEASEDLLEGRWLAAAGPLLDSSDGLYAIAPYERISSAEQSALMVREGPRRPADACETGDWAHVDVYLTKTRDYRALLFPGSRYDAQVMEWINLRGSTVVTVGGQVRGARAAVRYRHDTDPDVALLTETLVAELLAATWWSRG